jgi:hypothetical protein
MKLLLLIIDYFAIQRMNVKEAMLVGQQLVNHLAILAFVQVSCLQKL